MAVKIVSKEEEIVKEKRVEEKDERTTKISTSSKLLHEFIKKSSLGSSDMLLKFTKGGLFLKLLSSDNVQFCSSILDKSVFSSIKEEFDVGIGDVKTFINLLSDFGGGVVDFYKEDVFLVLSDASTGVKYRVLSPDAINSYEEGTNLLGMDYPNKVRLKNSEVLSFLGKCSHIGADYVTFNCKNKVLTLEGKTKEHEVITKIKVLSDEFIYTFEIDRLTGVLGLFDKESSLDLFFNETKKMSYCPVRIDIVDTSQKYSYFISPVDMESDEKKEEEE